MKRLSCVVFALLFLTSALMGQSDPSSPESDPAPGETEENREGEEPSEVTGKVDALGEAFTELKNIVDALNRLKVSAYIQAQYVDDESSKDEIAGSGTRNNDQFSVRRGRIKMVYTAAPTARATVAFDAASGGVTLKDAFVELIEPWTMWKNTLTAGQFKWPFGFEIGYSSSDREMPERTRVVRTLFPGERDRGFMVSGLGLADRFSYKVALVNGTGTSQSFDVNSDKDLVGRVGGTLGPLDIGISGYSGEDLTATSSRPTGVSTDKQRQGVDVQWITPVPGLGVRGEYIQGEEKGADVDGWYVYAIQNVGTRHQFVFRADDYDPNTNVENNATMTIGGAYIFHWDANFKIMLALEQPELEANDPDDNVSTVRFQYKF